MSLHVDRTRPILDKALDQPTAIAVAEYFMRGNVDAPTAPGKPAGCLFVQGALTRSDDGLHIRDELAQLRTAAEPLLRQRFERAVAEGDRPDDADPRKLASYLSTVSQGMAVQAAGGADREALLGIVDIAMQAWPRTRRAVPDPGGLKSGTHVTNGPVRPGQQAGAGLAALCPPSDLREKPMPAPEPEDG